METAGFLFGRKWRCALALLCCAAVLYFVAGGSLLHPHSKGLDTICHVCQAFHMPVLAAAPLQIAAVTEIIAGYLSAWHTGVPSDSFTLHRAGRAPPTA